MPCNILGPIHFLLSTWVLLVTTQGNLRLQDGTFNSYLLLICIFIITATICEIMISFAPFPKTKQNDVFENLRFINHNNRVLMSV